MFPINQAQIFNINNGYKINRRWKTTSPKKVLLWLVEVKHKLIASFAPTPITTKKAILKTFFGNPESEVLSVRFDQDDTMVAAACSDGGIKVYNLGTGILKFDWEANW